MTDLYLTTQHQIGTGVIALITDHDKAGFRLETPQNRRHEAAEDMRLTLVLTHAISELSLMKLRSDWSHFVSTAICFEVDVICKHSF